MCVCVCVCVCGALYNTGFIGFPYIKYWSRVQSTPHVLLWSTSMRCMPCHAMAVAGQELTTNSVQTLYEPPETKLNTAAGRGGGGGGGRRRGRGEEEGEGGGGGGGRRRRGRRRGRGRRRRGRRRRGRRGGGGRRRRGRKGLCKGRTNIC